MLILGRTIIFQGLKAYLKFFEEKDNLKPVGSKSSPVGKLHGKSASEKNLQVRNSFSFDSRP